MGRSSRVKGAGFEREIANLFRDRYGLKAHRGDQRRDGNHEADADWRGCPWWIECKRAKTRADIQGAVRQAEEASAVRPALVITRRDRDTALVTMRLTTFLALLDHLTRRGGALDRGVFQELK